MAGEAFDWVIDHRKGGGARGVHDRKEGEEGEYPLLEGHVHGNVIGRARRC